MSPIAALWMNPFGNRRRWRRHAGALAVMVAGCLVVFGTVLSMNATTDPTAVATGSDRTVVVLTPEPKPPRKKDRPKPRPAESRRATTAPAPSLGASLSGLSFGIPALEAAGLAADAREVVGGAGSRDLVMTEDAVDSPPRPVDRTGPEYPPRARAQGLTGEVVLSLLIGPGGDVLQVKVIDATPPGVFEDSAVRAVRTWRFEPGRYRDRPVKVWARQVVRFLQG